MASDTIEIEARGEVTEESKKSQSPWKKGPAAPPATVAEEEKNRPVMGSESWPALADAKTKGGAGDGGSAKKTTPPAPAPANVAPAAPPPPPTQVRFSAEYL